MYLFFLNILKIQFYTLKFIYKVQNSLANYIMKYTYDQVLLIKKKLLLIIYKRRTYHILPHSRLFSRLSKYRFTTENKRASEIIINITNWLFLTSINNQSRFMRISCRGFVADEKKIHI